jgi:hypothetical protein
MRQYLNLKRWRLLAIAVLTAIMAFAVIATSSEAIAQQPGESSHYTPENVGGNVLQLRGSYSEARNGGHLLAVWRGATNNQVWMAFDNGRPFTLGTTQTFVSRRWFPWGLMSSWFSIPSRTNVSILQTSLLLLQIGT